MKLRNTIILTVVLLMGFIATRFLLPHISMAYVNFSILLLLSIYVWTAIKTKVKQLKPSFKILFSMLYWLPISAALTASIALLISPLDDWPAFLRVYFVGGLFTYVVSLLLPVLFLFIADVVFFAEKLWRKSHNNRTHKGQPIGRRKFLVNTGLSLGGIALGTMGFGMLHGNYNFKIWRYSVNIKRSPQALKGLKIVQISDFHLGTWVSKDPLKEAVEYINELNADLVFFTGDLVNSITAEALPFKEELKKVKAKYGVFASLGNHDYGHYYNWKSKSEEAKNWDDLLQLYKDLGWRLLRNENELVEINGRQVYIVGVENWSINPRFPRIGDLDKASENIEQSDLNLLLSHDPTHWQEKVKKHAIPMDLTFSGHTHGFQFGIESKLFRWSPAQYIYKHWAGLYKDENSDKYLNVNRGIGAIGFPGRVGIKPEITLVELL